MRPGLSERWLDCQLSDIGVFTKGKGIRKDEVVPYGTPCVRYGEIYTHYNDYIREFRSFIPDEVALESCRIMRGDLLFAGSGETAEDIGKCVAFLGEEEAYAGGDIVIFTPYGQDSMYLGYLMNHSSITCQKARMAQGDAVVHISAANLGQLQLSLPPLSEQRAIASALSDVDALISSLDKLIAKKRDIKQAAMQQLLTGRRRLPGFSGRWEERRLEDVAALDSENLGGDTPRDYEFNYVSLEDVNRGILRGYANQLFSSAPSRARRVIRSGDVLVSTVRPNLGSHLLFKSSSPDWICSTGFSVVRCVEDAACPGYVFYHLFGDYVTRQIDAQLTGSSYPAISSKDVGNLRMPFPSIDEQRAIASVLSDMDAEIEALERRRDKTWLLKQGMMQELLTGRVRLV